MKLMLLLSLFAFTIPLPLNIYMSNSNWEWFERMTLSNKDLAGLKSWAHVFMVMCFTIATMHTIFSLKAEARKAYIKM